MDLEAIHQKYGEVVANVTTSMYYNGLQSIRDDGTLDEHERTERAWNLYDEAKKRLVEATERRNVELEKREDELRRSLFGGPGMFADPAERAAFSESLGRAALADDEALDRLAAAAEYTGNTTLAKAVFAEANRRGRGDIEETYLRRYPVERDKFSELKQIPDAEARANALDNATRVMSMSEPSWTDVAPTPDAQRIANEAKRARPLRGW